MAAKKQYLKVRNTCKVTLVLPKAQVQSCVNGDVGGASVVGDFNDWNPQAAPMTRRKNGDFAATFELEPGRAYQFRYLLDCGQWLNEADADGVAPTPYPDAHNSILTV